MADKSAIEWTDATWNPVRGCSRVSPGCGGPNHEGGCYAEKIAARFSDPGMPFHGFAERTAHGGRWTGKLALIEEQLDLPLRWRRPRRIFVNSMSDLFHESLPDEAIDRVFAVMDLAGHHTYQILTKRADRMRAYCSDPRVGSRIREHVLMALGPMTSNSKKIITEHWPLPNVWLGVSVEDQQRADERIPHLLSTPAAVRFLSCEPLLGPLDLTKIAVPDSAAGKYAGHGYTLNALQREDDLKLFNAPAQVNWVIAGGESGGNARPMLPAWARSLRDQCDVAEVPFFFKQWGEWAPEDDAPGAHTALHRIGKKRAGRLLDGIEHNAFPAPLDG